MSSYWVNFARTGNPNGKGLAAWPAYRDNHDRASGRAMALDLTPQVRDENATDAAKWEIYDKLYAKQMAAR